LETLAERLSRRKREGTRSVLAYLMAGSIPDEDFVKGVRALREAGVDGLEVGFPFSDPIAEGPVIQQAAVRALERSMRWERLLALLPSVSRELPTAVMTYLNPVLAREPARAFRELAGAGASALILPDLPLDRARSLGTASERSGVALVLLAAPASGRERLRSIARKTEGFLYLVSRYGTTGEGSGTTPSTHAQEVDLTESLRELHAVRPRLPVLVGFGISSPEAVERRLLQGADGVIVGSALQARLNAGEAAEGLGAVMAALVHAARGFLSQRNSEGSG
jgi:tryptophan synthase alpha chain